LVAKNKKKKKKGKGKKKKLRHQEPAPPPSPPPSTDGTQPPCNGVTCPHGCCKDGRCHPGTANTACEKHGVLCENCESQGEVCNAFQSCQCDDQLCQARGNFCCFDGRCIADGDFGVTCQCARMAEDCRDKPCCPGFECVTVGLMSLCCGQLGSPCQPGNCCDGLRCEGGVCVEAPCQKGCAAGTMCCNQQCVPIRLTNCEHCGESCPPGADRCVDNHVGSGNCLCGDGPPCDCSAGLTCVEGKCVCAFRPTAEGSPQQVCSASYDGLSCSFNGGGVAVCPGGNPPLCVCTQQEATWHGWCPMNR
jgi:hypothetical protein